MEDADDDEVAAEDDFDDAEEEADDDDDGEVDVFSVVLVVVGLFEFDSRRATRRYATRGF